MRRKDDISNRPTMQFIQLVEEFITATNELLTVTDKNLLKNLKLTKSLQPVLVAFASLEHTLQDPTGKLGVKVAVMNYETARTASLATSESLDKAYDKAIKEKEAADDAKNKLPSQHELDVARQKELRRATIDDVFKQELEAIRKTGEQIEDNINQDNDLAAKVATKREELRKLQRKIQGHCCGSKACNKEDLIKESDLETEINQLVDRQNKIKNRPTKATIKEEKIKSLEKKLADLKKKIDDTIDNYPAALIAAQKRVDDAARNLSNIERKIADDLASQCRVVSRDMMFDMVHLRARLSSFYRIVGEVYKKDESTKVLLDALLSSRELWRKRFNEALGCFYYPDIQGRTGLQFYTAYIEWAGTHEAEQKKIESAEYSPNEYIDYIVPEIKKQETPLNRKMSFGTVHDFFPAESKPKKKPSVDPVNATASMKHSSSTSSL